MKPDRSVYPGELARASASSVPPDPGRIVLVGDESEAVRSACAAMRDEFGGWRVRDTSEARTAFDWVERAQPAVLIVDVAARELGGLELVSRARDLWGAVATVAVTAFPPPAVRSGATSGTFAFLPRPFLAGALLEAVRDFEAKPPPSFGGAAAVTTLADLLQLHAAAGAAGVLTVRAGGLRGEVWFEAGQIVHARTAAKTGVEAFHDIARWPHGSFAWRARRPEARTIEAAAPTLLLEAYRGWGDARRSSEDLWDDAPSGRAAWGDPETSPVATSTWPPAPLPFTPSPLTQSPPVNDARETDTMNNINEILSRLQSIDGFIGACLVDSDSGMTLGIVGGGAALNLEVAAAGNTEVVRSKRKAMRALNLKDEIEDILITLGKQYHLMRPLRSRPGVFFYLAVERARANLAMARMTLADAEKDLNL